MGKTAKELRIEELKEIAAWKSTFGTEDGKKCLAMLRKEFYDKDRLADRDPVVTQGRAMQRDLVRYIIDQVEYKENDNG